MTLSENDPTLLFFGGQHLDEYVNGQRKKCCKHMDITLIHCLIQRFYFLFPSRTKTQKVKLILEPKPKARLTGSIECEKDM